MRAWCIGLVISVIGPSLPDVARGQAKAVKTEAAVDDPRLNWRAARWGCLVGGGVALALGAVSFVQGSEDEGLISDAERDPSGLVIGLTQREAFRLQSSAERSKSLGAVGIGVGVGLIAGGIVLWALEPDAPKPVERTPEPTVRPFSFLPSLSPDGPGFVLGTRF